MATQVTTKVAAKPSAPLRRAKLAQNDRIDSVLLRLDAIRTRKSYGTFVVGICGCERRAGVSTLTGNLAVRAAEMDMGRVLLIDANLKNPRQGSNFRLGNSPGLADVLNGRVEPEAACQETKIPGLRIMTAGTRKSTRNCVATPEGVKGMMAELRTDYDLIVIDLPHEMESARTQFLTKHSDGVVMIVDAQKTRARDARAALVTLRECEVEVLGTVLNRAKRTLPKWLEHWL